MLTDEERALLAAVEGRLSKVGRFTYGQNPDDKRRKFQPVLIEFNLDGTERVADFDPPFSYDTVALFGCAAADLRALLGIIRRLTEAPRDGEGNYAAYVADAHRYGWSIIPEADWNAIPAGERQRMLLESRQRAQAQAPRDGDE